MNVDPKFETIEKQDLFMPWVALLGLRVPFSARNDAAAAEGQRDLGLDGIYIYDVCTGLGRGYPKSRCSEEA